MNKRQYKKLRKKLYKHRYYDVRQEMICKNISSKYSNEMKNGQNILYIVDSRKMNLKHPISIKLFFNCIPISSN